MFPWDVYGDQIGQNVALWWEENGQKRMCLGLNDLKESRGYSHLKEEALDRTVWRAGFGKRIWTCRKTDC